IEPFRKRLQQKTSKYCGMKSHKSEDCSHKKKPNNQKCIMCRGKHASDSVLCPVIRKVREKIGIHFSREKVVILKKEKKQETQVHKQNEKKAIPINSQNVWKKKAEQRQKEADERT
ncbi:hypothetical protein RFI_34182, partial [Reticulomyxa filosa]